MSAPEFVPASARGARICFCGLVTQATRDDAVRAAKAINRGVRDKRRAVPWRCQFGSHHVTHQAAKVRARREIAHFTRRNREDRR